MYGHTVGPCLPTISAEQHASFFCASNDEAGRLWGRAGLLVMSCVVRGSRAYALKPLYTRIHNPLHMRSHHPACTYPVLAHKLDPHKQAQPAHVADDGVPCLQRPQAAHQRVAHDELKACE